MKQLLNEESLRMQRLAGIDPSNETFESVLKEFIEVIDEYEHSLNEDILNEGLWEKTKYYLSKLGRYKVNGEFGIGKRKQLDKEAEEKLTNIIEKETNRKVKELVDQIKKSNPEFPNNEKQEDFVKTCLEIVKLYDSIIAATKKDSQDKEFMPIDVANAVIADLRELVKDYLDRKLKSAYRSLNEEEFDLKKAIASIDDRSKEATGGDDKNRFQSHVYDTLKSNKLPMTLLSLGAAAGGLGWIWKMLSEEGTTVYEWIQDIQTLGNVQDGEGFTQLLNRTMDLNLSPDSSASEVAAAIKKIGGGDFNKGVEMLTQKDGIFEDPQEAKRALSLLGHSESWNEKTSLKDLFKGNLAGTGKSPFDMLVTKPGGVLAKMALKQVVKKGATTAAMAPLAKILGIVGVAGAIAAKFSRWKGLKSSRFKVLDGVYQTLRDIKPTEENPEVLNNVANNTNKEPKDAEKGAEKTSSTPAAETSIDQAKAIVSKTTKKQNRDLEIAGLLKMANTKAKTDMNDPEVKKTIQNLRKSPDTLINKVKSITGVDLSQRKKATGNFKRSGVAELSLNEMINEAAIDNALAKLGVSDEDIKKNSGAIVAQLMMMYNLTSKDVDLSPLPNDQQKIVRSITDELEDKMSGKPDQTKNSGDVSQIKKDIDSNSALKTALSKINTYDEFEALVLGMAAMVNPNLAQQKQDIKSALNSLASKIKQMNEEETETPTDTGGVYKIIDTLKVMKTHLNNINNKDEFEQLIFALLPHIDPKGQITKDKGRLASAIMAAANRNALKDTRAVDLDKLGK